MLISVQHFPYYNLKCEYLNKTTLEPSHPNILMFKNKYAKLCKSPHQLPKNQYSSEVFESK